MDNNNLNSFLSLGYFINYKNPKITYEISDLPDKKLALSYLSKEELLSEVNKIWNIVFDRCYFSNHRNVVPISGGLDSRAILATLLEFTEANNIYTYTFGTPGTYDYEIGNYIAKKIGTKHRSFSFNEYSFSTEKEIEVSKRTDHQTFLYHHPPLELLDDIYKDSSIWSGFMLDWIAGSHLPHINQQDLNLVKNDVFHADLFVKSIDLLNIDPREVARSLEIIPIDYNVLSYNEQLESFNRYPKYIAPNILFKDCNFILPGYEKEIYSFFMALDPEYRRKETLYKEFLIKRFPQLFSMPIKAFNGLSLSSKSININLRKTKNKLIKSLNKIYPFFLNPHTNYMDFNEGIRRRQDLNRVVHTNIMDLKNRKIVDWIDIDKIYKNHMSRKKNHADALIILSSLEIHLKAGKVI